MQLASGFRWWVRRESYEVTWRSATEVHALGGGALRCAESGGVEGEGRRWVWRGGCEVTWRSAIKVHVKTKQATTQTLT